MCQVIGSNIKLQMKYDLLLINFNFNFNVLFIPNSMVVIPKHGYFATQS